MLTAFCFPGNNLSLVSLNPYENPGSAPHGFSCKILFAFNLQQDWKIRWRATSGDLWSVFWLWFWHMSWIMVCKLLQSFVLHSDGRGNRDGINFPVCKVPWLHSQEQRWAKAVALRTGCLRHGGYGEQRLPESDNLDTICRNFHRHPAHPDKFRISSLSITSHNHSSIFLQSSSHA